MPRSPNPSLHARCDWCGARVEPDDGFRLGEEAGARRAAFCRLEHVVPWAMRGPHWEAGELVEPPGLDDALAACSHCGAALGEPRLLLVHRRGERRIPDGFGSVEHVAAWAKAGGRWR